MGLPFGDEVNYWQTSKSSPDKWIERTRTLIEALGGTVLGEGFGSEPMINRSAFLLRFEIGGNQFKLIWPVLPTRKKSDEYAAKVQAATMIYHDVKAKCLSAVVLGARAAFFSYLMLPDGRTAVEASVSELKRGIPAMFSTPQLGGGEIVDGEVVG